MPPFQLEPHPAEPSRERDFWHHLSIATIAPADDPHPGPNREKDSAALPITIDPVVAHRPGPNREKDWWTMVVIDRGVDPHPGPSRAMDWVVLHLVVVVDLPDEGLLPGPSRGT